MTDDGQPEMKRQWYVLRVQTSREGRVKEAIDRRVRAAGLEDQIGQVLVPTQRISEIKSGKKTITERKIYPGYVMVEMEMNESTVMLIRETPGVGDFLGTRSFAVPMSDREVEKITAEVRREQEEAPAPKIEFGARDSVRIKEGPFVNFDGLVEEVIPEKGLVRVVVTIFGRPTPVELEYWQVERI